MLKMKVTTSASMPMKMLNVMIVLNVVAVAGNRKLFATTTRALSTLPNVSINCSIALCAQTSERKLKANRPTGAY